MRWIPSTGHTRHHRHHQYRYTQLAHWATALFLAFPVWAQAQPDTRLTPPPPPSRFMEATREPGIERGRVAFYHDQLTGRKTANGERYDPKALTMAHPSLPFGTRVRVINLSNHRNVVVRVNDRGPVSGKKNKRIADISRAAAEKLRMIEQGVVTAELEIVWRPEPGDGPDSATSER